MDKLQMRIRPSFLWSLLGIFLFALFLSSFFEHPVGKTRAMVFNTINDERQIASGLQQRAIATGSLSNIDNSFIFHALFGTNDYRFGYRTNTLGEVLDIWEMPYQIQIVARTNFVIRSAGPNKKFGDADDIIFNSVSNDFVKP
jgi:hypothetical protein